MAKKQENKPKQAENLPSKRTNHRLDGKNTEINLAQSMERIYGSRIYKKKYKQTIINNKRD